MAGSLASFCFSSPDHWRPYYYNSHPFQPTHFLSAYRTPAWRATERSGARNAGAPQCFAAVICGDLGHLRLYGLPRGPDAAIVPELSVGLYLTPDLPNDHHLPGSA